MNVGLIGCGAVGAVIARKLNKVSRLYIISDEKRTAFYKREGVVINGERQDFDYVSSPACKLDLIIIAVKNYQLDDAIFLAKPFADENTVFLSLLNGIDSERKLELHFKPQNVLYSFITNISSNKSGNEITVFSGREGIVVFSSADNKLNGNVKKIEALFIKAKIDYDIPKDIHKAQWWKFLLNCAYNTISAVLLTPYSKIYSNEAFLLSSRMVCEEVVKVANAEGVFLDDEDIEKVIAQMMRIKDEGKTSMLQDIESGRATENDFFCKTVVTLGRKHGLETPVCAFLYQLLEAASYARK